MKQFFTIIIPTFNRADRIAGTLQSVLNQNYENFELIIVDDGSTDHTKDIITAFVDKRIRYFKKENEERAIARNFGIDKAKGDYITFLDSDDRLYPHYFQEASNIVEYYGEPEWLHLAYEIKDEKEKVLRRENTRFGNINKSLVTGNHLSCIGVFVRKDIIKKHQFNTDPDIIGSEDYLLWMKFASKYPLRYSNRISAFMIQHSGRSVEHFSVIKLEKRIEKSIHIIIKETHILKDNLKFVGHRYAYLSLHCFLSGYKLKGFNYLLKSIFTYPLILFTKKTIFLIYQLFQ